MYGFESRLAQGIWSQVNILLTTDHCVSWTSEFSPKPKKHPQLASVVVSVVRNRMLSVYEKDGFLLILILVGFICVRLDDSFVEDKRLRCIVSLEYATRSISTC